MIVPQTRMALALVPIERLTFTEHQPRYLDRVLHYVALLNDPAHAADCTGPIALCPLDDAGDHFTVLDGHHRALAHIIAGRTHILALIQCAPGQPGYDEQRWFGAPVTQLPPASTAVATPVSTPAAIATAAVAA